MMRTAIVAATAAVAMSIWMAAGGWTGQPSEPVERAQAAGSDSLTVSSPALDLAQDDEGVESKDGQRVWVQVWTLVAVAGAGGVGLLLLLVRMALGWVQSPPPIEESDH